MIQFTAGSVDTDEPQWENERASKLIRISILGEQPNNDAPEKIASLRQVARKTS
jgi:hypothetical protein